jgi:hypothetical protein
MRRSSGR